MGLEGVVISAVVCFASTNIDDALVLVVYFAAAAEGEGGFRRIHVWAGQLHGFTTIVLMSLVGGLTGSFLPTEYSGLLGFVPMFIGLSRMRQWLLEDVKERSDNNEFEAESVDNDEASVETTFAPATRLNSMRHQSRPAVIKPTTRPITSPSPRRDLAKRRNPTVHPHHEPITNNSQPLPKGNARVRRLVLAARDHTMAMLAAVCGAHSLKVAAVAVANGGDNVAIYVPLLVTYSAGEVLVTLAVFYVLLVIWIFLADVFVSFRLVASAIERYGQFVVPIALVLLGIHILLSNNVLGIVCSSC